MATDPSPAPALPELGFYTLAGQPRSPRDLVAEVAAGEGMALGSAFAQFDLGVDGVIMHGATPDELAPVVEAYRAERRAGRFDHLAANPGIAGPAA